MAAKKHSTTPDKARRSAPGKQPAGRSARLSKAHREALKAMDSLPPAQTAIARTLDARARETLLSGEPLLDGEHVHVFLERD